MVEEQPKITWTDVESSNVKRVAYYAPTHTLGVEYNNGYLYSYRDVGMDVYVGAIHAESVGRYLNRVVKGVYAYERHLSLEGLENFMIHHH